MIRRCKKCGKDRQIIIDFYHWDKSGKCKSCLRQISRDTYRRNPEGRLRKQRAKKVENAARVKNKYNEDPEYRKKALARAKARYALKTGKIIKPSVCEVDCCNSTDIVIHHYDYDRPLDVMWVCFKCHHKIHRIDNNEMV